MSFQLQVNDTSKINKPLWKVIADGVYIGRLLSIQWKGFNLYRTLLSTLRYTTTSQKIQTLQQSQIRIIDDCVLVRGKLTTYYQLFFPFLDNLPEDLQLATFTKYTDFLDNITSYGDLEIFYYDREETLSDYEYYFDQLDSKQAEFKYFHDNGSELAHRLRDELPDLLSEIITANKSRVREAFLIVSVDCKAKNLGDITKARELLETKVNKVTVSLQEINIDYLKVEGQHRDWFLTNFVSHTAKF